MATPKRVVFVGFARLKEKLQKTIDLRDVVHHTAVKVYVDPEAPAVRSGNKAPIEYAGYVLRGEPSSKQPMTYRPAGTGPGYLTRVLQDQGERKEILGLGVAAFKIKWNLIDLFRATGEAYVQHTVLRYTPEDTGALRGAIKMNFVDLEESVLLNPLSAEASGGGTE